MNLLTHIYDIDDKKCLLQCACGKQVTKSIRHWQSGRAVSCGCWTKDGRQMSDGERTKHPLYGTWSVNHRNTYPNFNLMVAELGNPPYPEATITTKDDSKPFQPGNVCWGPPIFTLPKVTATMGFPLDPDLFAQYNIDAYKESTNKNSWHYSLDALTQAYDKIRLEHEDDPVKLETIIEDLSRNEAIEKYIRNEAKTEGSATAHTSSVWAQVKAKFLPIIIEDIEEEWDKALTGKAGVHRAAVAPVLSSGLIEPEEIALITLNTTLDCLGDGLQATTPMTRLYKTIGQKIDDQCWMKWWAENYPSEFHYVDKWILHSNSGYYYKVRKAVTWVQTNIKEMPPHAYKRLSQLRDDKGRRFGDDTLIHLGQWAFARLQHRCLWFQEDKVREFSSKGIKDIKVLALSPEGYKYRHVINLGIQELLFEAQPMVCEPLPWNEEYSKMYHGGYLTPQPLSFSKLIHHNKGTKPSPEAIRSLNKLQNVGWKVNPFMYHTLKELMGTDTTIGTKFVCFERDQWLARNSPPKEVLLDLQSDDEDKVKKAKSALARMYSKAKQAEQLANNPFRCMKTAAKFLNYERFYFPCYFDNRLRIYYLNTSGFGPQGANYAKSLLLFADPLPVTDENRDEVERDLLISIANCYGNDKISLDERVEFARDIAKSYELVAAEPLAAGHLAMWDEVAEPFTFLATLRQYHEIFTWKTRTTTDIPNGRDASSSGLQLMSALLREEKAMTYTNVIPGDKPADLYGEVARHATALLRNDPWLHAQLEERVKNTQKKSEKTGKNIDLSNIYFRLDPDKHITRKTAKRAVMTDSYNASWQSKNEYISDELMALEGELGRKVTLAEKVIVTNAIVKGQEQAFTICKDIKEFMKQVIVEAIGKQGKDSIIWHTPCGSQLRQKYNLKSRRQVKTFAMGTASVPTDSKTTWLTLEEEKPQDIDHNHHVTAFSPNLHHSYDAYIAQQTILHAPTDVIQSTHDCFYGRAGEVGSIVDTAKDCFLKLVRSDVLEDLLRTNNVEYLTIPIKGDDSLLDNVMSSDYMFA